MFGVRGAGFRRSGAAPPTDRERRQLRPLHSPEGCAAFSVHAMRWLRQEQANMRRRSDTTNPANWPGSGGLAGPKTTRSRHGRGRPTIGQPPAGVLRVSAWSLQGDLRALGLELLLGLVGGLLVGLLENRLGRGLDEVLGLL